MPKLFIKIAFRYLLKNKLYSFLNIFGLALGIATFIVIGLYVSYERSYDNFKGSDQVVRVYMDYAEGGNFSPGDAQTYNLTGPTLKNEFPEVEEQVRLYRLEKVTFVNGDKVIEQPNGSLADETYFDIFKYPVIKGSITKFSQPNSIVLTESLSDKLFGSENSIGKTISVFYSTEVLVEVVAIMEDIPENTHFKTNFLISFATMNTWDAMSGQNELNWNQNNFFTYLKLAEHTDFKSLQSKIVNSDFEQDPDERHNIEPLADIHLHSDKPYEAETNGSISRIRFLTAIAIIVLVLSWLNYINLSTAKSLERSKEIGIRKVAGAQRPQLIIQSLVESIVLNLIAFGLAIILLLMLLPVFNNYTGKGLSFEYLDYSTIWPFLMVMLFGTILSSLYPAFVLSQFSPIKALKGKRIASSSGIWLRKGMISLQFFATVILIVGTLVVGNQMAFLRDQPIGAELGQVIALKGTVLEAHSDSIMLQKLDLLKTELKKLSVVDQVANARTYPGDGYDNLSSTVGITGPDGIVDERQLFYIYGADPDYFDLLSLEFLAGSSYPKMRNGETNRNIVLNETFSKLFGFQNASDIIGKQIKFWGIDWTVSGVIKDYHHFGLKNAIAPLIIGPYNGMENIIVKLDEQSGSFAGLDAAMSKIKTIWSSIFPQSTLSYNFLDEKFDSQYAEDKKFGTAFQIFTGLAILIAMLGLFGLTAFATMQRRKEIGIRKVSGATVFQILALINKEFLKWVAIAFVVATPVAWYIMKHWLNEFAYKSTLSWWIFALAGLSVCLIAIITVSVQALKAAVANPTKSLRTE